ncbi:long-chain fatty acid--CoA ligase [Bacillus sp. V5-8f]|uniref:long-chain fatty acid--CoA ligase n=1 Tax=Bacillus sp. V5-8f TaxID=2053044 RepID=UPI000C76C984|nr:long-chain fatty acid--CoA ligase [Bacillus sp. V5-8f]PLT35534.1 long-chain fatty acid--CoA ligase [Bacillus sp. V5-8f]
MNKNHFAYWPKRVTKTLTVPETTLFDNLEVSARRYPKKAALYYYGAEYSYQELLHEVEAIAGYLQQKLNVKKGDRVALFMQNSPQFLITYYAIVRTRAIVVPINPMNTENELSFYIKDCEIQTAIVGQELFGHAQPLQNTTSLKNILVAAYSDYLPQQDSPQSIPSEVAAPRNTYSGENQYLWKEAIEEKLAPSQYTGHADDVVVLPYTSGTTGLPKGCIHTNRTVQANVLSAYYWSGTTSDSVSLTTLPLFHVTGMVHSMHAPIYAGAAMVMLTRWDRNTAVEAIQKYKCSHWVNISTMLIDFLANPNLIDYDISSLSSISGGGAPLPEAVGEKLFKLTGLKFVEGYGLSETISQTHFNPPDRPKMQCLGIPAFDVDAKIIDPASLEELPPGSIGEIIVHGPQVFKGYYNRPEETEQAFIEKGGKRFFRTGDIGKMDEEGYYFMVDRVKRMINASGYKVWPTEVESLLYKHPAVEQACVVGVPDAKRGETVKAFIILNQEFKGKVSEDEIISWAKTQMAAYKYPRFVEFRDSFPTTASGKILWRKLQEEEKEKAGTVAGNE